MKKYTTILFDMDNTIFDFDEDERSSLIKTFKQFDIPATNETLTGYSQINDALWKRFEKGEITKEDIKNTRFKTFLEKFGFVCDATPGQINDCYAENLAHSGNLIEGAMELCIKLKSYGYKLYIVTNGLERTQLFRINKTGIDKIADAIFISETIGYQKPLPQFFEYVFENIEEKNKEKIILIGDSLTSDIKGALNAGIDCIWYDRKNSDYTLNDLPTFKVKDIREIENILID